MDVTGLRANEQDGKKLRVSSVLVGRRVKMLKTIPGRVGGGRKGVKRLLGENR